jgi:YebC/PmpR family DNA-binding regulatory protein
MSGHSKWASIKRQKGATDAKRGALFTKLGNAITIAARAGGGDPATNFKLRIEIDKARAANLPKDNIERAIKRGTGEESKTQIEEVTYEGYGPGKVAIIVKGITDNKNRTISAVRQIFEKHGGTLGQSGAVSWMFDAKGVIRVNKAGQSAEELELKAIDLGAQDLKEEGTELVIYTEPDKLQTVKDGLEKNNMAIEFAELDLVPQNYTKFDDAIKEKLMKLFEALDEDPDVSNYYSNFK